MKVTKEQTGIYKVELNGKVYKIAKKEFSSEWEVFEVKINGYGNEETEWENTLVSKKSAILWLNLNK